MFIVTLHYVADLTEIDAAAADHMTWVGQQYDDGVVVASGRQVPRTGGVLLFADLTRDDLEKRLALDPFQRRGLATAQVTEFAPTRVAPGLEQLLPAG